MLIPKFYCLTLPERPNRRAKAEAHFKARGVDVVFFDALHAPTAGLRTRFPYEVDAPGCGWNMGPIPVGIFLAHYMLWNALTLLPDTHAIILEDDAKFPEDWRPRFEAAFRDVPQDFDMLFLGSCCTWDKKPKHIAGRVFDVRYPQCLHCYSVAQKALPLMMATNRKIYGPVDCTLMFHTMPHRQVFTVLPRIVDQFDTNIPA